MNSTQFILFGVTILAFGGLAFGMSRSISKYEKNKSKIKKKKGKTKYLQESKNPGR